MNYKYFIGDECRDNCDGYYKLEDTTSGVTTCYDLITNALKDANVMYYNIK